MKLTTRNCQKLIRLGGAELIREMLLVKLVLRVDKLSLRLSHSRKQMLNAQCSVCLYVCDLSCGVGDFGFRGSVEEQCSTRKRWVGLGFSPRCGSRRVGLPPGIKKHVNNRMKLTKPQSFGARSFRCIGLREHRGAGLPLLKILLLAERALPKVNLNLRAALRSKDTSKGLLRMTGQLSLAHSGKEA